jgi:hypothetical protein
MPIELAQARTEFMTSVLALPPFAVACAQAIRDG